MEYLVRPLTAWETWRLRRAWRRQYTPAPKIVQWWRVLRAYVWPDRYERALANVPTRTRYTPTRSTPDGEMAGMRGARWALQTEPNPDHDFPDREYAPYTVRDPQVGDYFTWGQGGRNGVPYEEFGGYITAIDGERLTIDTPEGVREVLL